jgi:hypothetical protein
VYVSGPGLRTLSDLRGSEGLWCRVSWKHDYLNAQIVRVDEGGGKVAVRLADGSIDNVHWSLVRL